MEITFTSHAVKSMITRQITVEEVIEVTKYGEAIADYADDKPGAFQIFAFMWVVRTRPTAAAPVRVSTNRRKFEMHPINPIRVDYYLNLLMTDRCM
jgi:hypothetical protein